MTATMEQIRYWSPWLLSHWLWPMLWQSSVLAGALLLLDFALRRKLRPAVRYALWLVLLVKLILPPSLALPSSLAWWLRPTTAPLPKTHPTTVTVHYGPAVLPEPTIEPPAPAPPPPPPLPLSAWALIGSGLVSLALLGWMLVRWAQVARTARNATEAPDWLNDLLAETKKAAGVRRVVRLRLAAAPLSPAVCGFFRPVILLPQALANLPAGRLRTVLLHELIHLSRGDVWINCIQALLQVVYSWHPLLWLANARIRRLREEAVDDAVMLALRDEAADYAPTLLEVARLALQRPLTSLGLVGILESKTALRRRIERLVDFHAPQKAGPTLFSVVGLGLFTAMAVPMGEAPPAPQRPNDTRNPQNSLWPDLRFDGYSEVRLEPQFYIADGANLRAVLPALLENDSPLVLNSNDVNLETTLRQANAQAASASEPFAKFSGGTFTWKVGGTTNTMLNYHAKEAGGRTIVVGADVGLAATAAGWVPLEFSVVPWNDDNQVRCRLELGLSGNINAVQRATIVLPEHGAMLWAQPLGGFSGRYELVLLRRASSAESQQTVRAAAPASSTNSQTSPTAQLESFLKAQTKTQDGKLLFEMGKLDEAEATLAQAVILNPQSQAAQYYLNLVQEARRQPVNRNANAPSFPAAPTATNVSHSTASRKAIYSKLSQIRLDAISFNNAPLGDVLEELTRLSQARDPQKRGINFIINNSVERAAAADTGVPRPVPIDPVTGLAIPQAGLAEQTDIRDVSIKILPPLTDVTLGDVLDAIVKVADKRIKYAIEDYGVVFSIKRVETPPLYTRIIKVDPNTLKQGLEGVIGFDWGSIAQPNGQRAPSPAFTSLTRTNDTVQALLRQFFLTMGVDLNPPKSIFFNDREGTLVVRANLQDLDTIEQAVQVLNITPPQIHIKAKFFAVPTEQLAALELEGGIYPAGAQTEKILTAPLAKAFLKALESNSNVDLIAESSVTTLSGRQTEVQVVSDVSDPAQTNNQSFLGFGKIANLGSLPTNPPPAGVTLDIYPFAHADEPTIQISGKAVATEFLGFDSPGPFMIQRNWDTRLLKGDAVVIGQSATPIPHFRVREHTFASIVYDGQTLLLGSMPSNVENKNSATGQSQKSLLVLITPTLIDPAGNRIYKDDQPQK